VGIVHEYPMPREIISCADRIDNKNKIEWCVPPTGELTYVPPSPVALMSMMCKALLKDVRNNGIGVGDFPSSIWVI
jgi:hypothetical protein